MEPRPMSFFAQLASKSPYTLQSADPFPIKISHSQDRISTPIEHMVPLAHQSPQPKQHLNRFSYICRAHDRDRPTDHATLSVTIGRIYVLSNAMWPNNDNNNKWRQCR